jgi:hypothetical protein
LVYTEHTPAGTSTTNILHWIQVNVAKKMQKFDYGSAEKNQLHYGQVLLVLILFTEPIT